MPTGDSYRIKDSKSQLWSAEDIDAILILRLTCTQLETLELTGMLPACRKDDEAAKGSSKSNQDGGRDAYDCTSSSQSAYRELVSEEKTRDMDVDTSSQWTIDVRLQDVEGVVVNMENDDDSPMDIDATASELAFHRVLECLDEVPANSCLVAIVAWLETLGCTFETDMVLGELAVNRHHRLKYSSGSLECQT